MDPKKLPVRLEFLPLLKFRSQLCSALELHPNSESQTEPNNICLLLHCNKYNFDLTTNKKVRNKTNELGKKRSWNFLPQQERNMLIKAKTANIKTIFIFSIVIQFSSVHVVRFHQSVYWLFSLSSKIQWPGNHLYTPFFRIWSPFHNYF